MYSTDLLLTLYFKTSCLCTVKSYENSFVWLYFNMITLTILLRKMEFTHKPCLFPTFQMRLQKKIIHNSLMHHTLFCDLPLWIFIVSSLHSYTHFLPSSFFFYFFSFIFLFFSFASFKLLFSSGFTIFLLLSLHLLFFSIFFFSSSSLCSSLVLFFKRTLEGDSRLHDCPRS